jgi:hypothetical protein
MVAERDVGAAWRPEDIQAMKRFGTLEAQAGTFYPAQAAAWVRGIAQAYERGTVWSSSMPSLHFVGFKDDRYWSAVKVFGLPDFYHRIWDVRARQEVMPGDIAIFATGDETMPLYRHGKTGELISWDDSQQDIIARGEKGVDW